MKKQHCYILLFLLFSISINTFAKVSAIEVLKVKDIIWGMDFISEYEILLTERDGRISHANLLTKVVTPVTTPKVKARGQGGMLDVAIKKIGQKTYAYYTFSMEENDSLFTALGRAEYKNKALIKPEILFKSKIKSDTTRHFGSRVAFKDNHIFMTVGDRGERKYAQDLSVHNGKVLRLNLDGSAAKGNPFEAKPGALKEIYSYGHRNPQGIAISQSGNVYSCEFGPRGGDELNLVEAGKNYGWPIITYGSEYWGPSIGTTQKPGLEQPLVHWTPSISPSGMAIYEADLHKQWKGHILMAALGSEHLRLVKLNGNKVVAQEAYLEDLEERMRQVRVSPKGEVYLTTDSGKILKVTYKK